MKSLLDARPFERGGLLKDRPAEHFGSYIRIVEQGPLLRAVQESCYITGAMMRHGVLGIVPGCSSRIREFVLALCLCLHLANGSGSKRQQKSDATKLLSIRDKDGDRHLSFSEVFAGGQPNGILKQKGKDDLSKQANVRYMLQPCLQSFSFKHSITRLPRTIQHMHVYLICLRNFASCANVFPRIICCDLFYVSKGMLAPWNPILLTYVVLTAFMATQTAFLFIDEDDDGLLSRKELSILKRR